jgi:hypothetical protein
MLKVTRRNVSSKNEKSRGSLYGGTGCLQIINKSGGDTPTQTRDKTSLYGTTG